jgi:sugar-specific transcriptional regulator TrmB
MNNSIILSQLEVLGFNKEESIVYMELLKGPRTHLQISKAAGVNRTKVYRIIEHLERQSVVSKRIDDRGTFLMASDPSSLEVALITQEENIKQQRAVLGQLIPALSTLQGKDMQSFAVRTYDGAAGLKQMCWHELKAENELLSMGNGTIEQMISDKNWALEHRRRQIGSGHATREIVNYDYTTSELPELASELLIKSQLYSCRILSPTVLAMAHQTTIYNDTVAIYHWKQEKKVGIEILSASYAAMMRQIFEEYWQKAEKTSLSA